MGRPRVLLPRGGMNRLSLKIVAVALVALFLGVGSADARTKKKPKKAYDLNANPLAGV